MESLGMATTAESHMKEEVPITEKQGIRTRNEVSVIGDVTEITPEHHQRVLRLIDRLATLGRLLAMKVQTAHQQIPVTNGDTSGEGNCADEKTT